MCCLDSDKREETGVDCVSRRQEWLPALFRRAATARSVIRQERGSSFVAGLSLTVILSYKAHVSLASGAAKELVDGSGLSTLFGHACTPE